VFLISLYVIGNYIMLSLFLAILLSNFGNADELKEVRILSILRGRYLPCNPQ
jgi:hypothetical protein